LYRDIALIIIKFCSESNHKSFILLLLVQLPGTFKWSLSRDSFATSTGGRIRKERGDSRMDTKGGGRQEEGYEGRGETGGKIRKERGDSRKDTKGGGRQEEGYRGETGGRMLRKRGDRRKNTWGEGRQ